MTQQNSKPSRYLDLKSLRKASAMSVTTTANAGVVTLRQTLAEYELHHSETNPNPERGLPAPAPNATPQISVTNPPNWDTAHRRVPSYRPARPENNDEERNTYSNNVERIFIALMLNGVHTQSSASHLWRATGEKIVGPSWFRHKLGGEW